MTPKMQATTIPAIVPPDGFPPPEVFGEGLELDFFLGGLGGGGVYGGGGGAGDVLNEFPSYLFGTHDYFLS